MKKVLLTRGTILLFLVMVHGYLTGLIRAMKIEIGNSRISTSLDLTGSSVYQNELLKIFDGSQLQLALNVLLFVLVMWLAVNPVVKAFNKQLEDKIKKEEEES